jgi:hypothetical protein
MIRVWNLCTGSECHYFRYMPSGREMYARFRVKDTGKVDRHHPTVDERTYNYTGAYQLR